MYRTLVIGAPILSVVLFTVTCASANQGLPPIQKLKGAKPQPSVFKAASQKKPLVIRSQEDAAKHFSEQELAKLTKQVDFGKQVILVFAWRGSGQDRLEFNILESFPEQVVFQYKPGRTRDLRPHVYVYALRSNVKWRIGGKAGNVPRRKPNEGPRKKPDEYVKVEFKGKLNSGVVAIGGETTGVVITARGITWELDFGRDAEIRKQADALNGKTVIVTGQLSVKRGVEIPRRWIVAVDSLKNADKN